MEDKAMVSDDNNVSEKESGEKNMSLEESFEKLDEIIKKLEDGKMPLEESFGLYREGMELLKNGRDQIDTIEKKVQQINEDGEISDFDPE